MILDDDTRPGRLPAIPGFRSLLSTWHKHKVTLPLLGISHKNLFQVMLAEKNLYFLIKKTPEQDLKKYGIPNTPSLRRQMSIKNRRRSATSKRCLNTTRTRTLCILVPMQDLGSSTEIFLLLSIKTVMRYNYSFNRHTPLCMEQFNRII